jgi:signal transduction histidine kinase
LPKQFSRVSTLLVVIIVGAAAALSVLSYQYSTTAATHILDIGSEEARSNAEIQAHDLSTLLGKQVESATNNLETISSARSIQNQDVEGAILLLNGAQKSTEDITSAYSWLDKDGKLLWATTFGDAAIRQQFAGADFSYREYYSQPRDTLKPYYSTLFESIDGVPTLTISYPIIEKQFEDAEGNFKGIVVAAIKVNTLGKFVQDQLVPDYKSSVGLMDRNGIILYSSSSPQYVGKSIFGPEIQSILQPDVKEPFNQFIRDSLSGNTGSGDFTSQGRTSTIAYKPVTIGENEFAIMYIVTPHALASSAVVFIEQLRVLNVVTVIALGAIGAGVVAVVLVWNKRLTKVVAAKTSELEFSNESLSESNRQLQISNTKLRDVNDHLAQAIEQLKVHDKLQNEFVNIAAHELRTPIQPLLGAAEIMESQFEDNDKIEVTRAEIDMIVRNAKRLERLSSDILEISRIESGAMKLNDEAFSLSYIIADAIKDAKARSIYDPAKLTILYIPDNIFVHADKDKIAQVLSNLLSNAIKFTAGSAGTIKITTETDAQNNMAIVTVEDSGSGINPEVMPKLFDKFVTKSEKGTGIGLYISKKMVEAHGGKIWGENNLAGPGAIFGFTLPLADAVMSGMQDHVVEQQKQAGTVATTEE